MSNNPLKKYLKFLLWGFVWVPLTAVQAQETEEEELEDEEIEQLSPFVVEGSDTDGYSATATLAGTRVRTDLRDIASSISVVTDQFLSDTAATSQQELLVYTTNTEVGGLLGNYAGVGNTQGVSNAANLISPSNNTRVRGLEAADNTRDFFLTDIPWDSYNVDRVDLQRGPNSILFGVGSPSGIINTSTIPAVWGNSGEYQNMIDQNGRFRNSLNINREVIEDMLAVRVAALHDDEKYQQQPAFEEDERLFFALRFENRFLGDDHGPLTLRANYEYGNIAANRPRTLPPYDRVTPFFDADKFNRQTYDAHYSWTYDRQVDRGTRAGNLTFPEDAAPWLSQQMSGIIGPNPVFYIDNLTGNTMTIRPSELSANFGIGSDGAIDRGIERFPFARLQDVAGLNEYSLNASAVANVLGNPDPFPAASKNFYKDRVLMDPAMFDFYNVLIDGNTKREWNDWDAYNIALSQTFFGDRFGVEFVYDYQEVHRGGDKLFGNVNISVDINEYYNVGPSPYTNYNWREVVPGQQPGGIDNRTANPNPLSVTGGARNPNAGRMFVSGVSRFGNSWETIERENYRFTAFAELRASDLFEEDSFMEKLLGRHVFTGLASEDNRDRNNAQYQLFAMEPAWAEALDLNPSINNFDRSVSYMFYLTNNVQGLGSASQASPGRVNVNFNPQGEFMIGYFDSNWAHPLDPNAPGYINPADPYISGLNGAELTQAENPDNYVGYVERPFRVLNAREGDIDQMYQSGSRRVDVLTSTGFTWQGFFWDGLVVPTVGWREDEIETYGSGAPQIDQNTQVVDPFFTLNQTPDNTQITKGETVTWGVVVHTPDFIREMLPWGTNFSFYYNEAENFRAVNRVGFDAQPLPAPSGDTTDFGIGVSTLENRLNFKVTWYETKVSEADLPGGNPLGSNSWYLWNQEAWGTAAAVIHEAWRAGEAPGMGWYSNFAWGNFDGSSPSTDPPQAEVDALYQNNPDMIAQAAAIKDWYATMPSQEWFDGYGFPVDVSAAQSSDLRTRLDGAITDPSWTVFQGIGGIQPAGGGSINGIFPVGTINQLSEGVEIEVNARPMPNWNLTFNVSKTDAARTALGESFRNWILSRQERYAGPAGDLRQWWAGDRTVREYFDDFIMAPFEFQQDANGQQAAEIRPWRFNFVTDYTFQEGWARGIKIGGAYRWEDDLIVGYDLDDTQTKLDINRPIFGASQDSIDLWLGYKRSLGEHLDWRVQLNVRNVGEDDELIPVSVNPGGQVAAARISLGQMWTLTNTFEF